MTERSPGQPDPTDVQESDPSADSHEGLAGDLGISSEVVGKVRGSEQPATYGVEQPFPDRPDRSGAPSDEEDVPPEQSSDPASGPEVHPDPPVRKEHPGRLHGSPSAQASTE